MKPYHYLPPLIVLLGGTAIINTLHGDHTWAVVHLTLAIIMTLQLFIWLLGRTL